MESKSLALAIPDHMIAYIGGYHRYPCTQYALWKGGHLLIIQVPCISKRDPYYYVDNEETQEELERDYRNVLEIIQSIIDTIEFDKTNWACLTRKSGSYQLVQKMKKYPSFMAPLCAPFIEESEIKLKRFINGNVEERVGEWNGQEVDIYRAWNPESLYRLHVMYENYRALEALDLTFQVLGNLVDSDGTIVGLVTEPNVGREIRNEDRSLVYKAIANLQKQGIYSREFWTV
ncbi:hypothetical protein BDQ17DRAFT_1434787 [Cyathus striatus]|nr:hypothetical protein BDQ17DRAFT_1434787 [Cyathus striatus]